MAVQKVEFWHLHVNCILNHKITLHILPYLAIDMYTNKYMM